MTPTGHDERTQAIIEQMKRRGDVHLTANKSTVVEYDDKTLREQIEALHAKLEEMRATCAATEAQNKELWKACYALDQRISSIDLKVVA